MAQLTLVTCFVSRPSHGAGTLRGPWREVPRASHLLLADREKVWLSPAAAGGELGVGALSPILEAGPRKVHSGDPAAPVPESI